MGLYVWKFGYRKILDPLARLLAGVDPDWVGFAALIVAMLTALCYLLAPFYNGLLLVAILLIFTRMTMNTIDGVMAIQRGKKTLVGEVVNALPDRFSDVFVLLGLVFSPLCDTSLAVLGMASVFLVSYTGMLGKAVGVGWQHHGPLGKVERLILLMIFTLGQYLWASGNILGLRLSFLSWLMVGYIVLGCVTVWNRLRGMLDEIAVKEWSQTPLASEVSRRAVVIYDSQTGNTAALAAAIAATLGIPMWPAREKLFDPARDWWFVCTPNIRGDCTPALAAYLAAASSRPRAGAVVVSYGAPLWGLPTALFLVARVAGRMKTLSCSFFLSKGYHAKFKTYPGRPNEADKTRAMVFAIRAAESFGRTR